MTPDEQQVLELVARNETLLAVVDRAASELRLHDCWVVAGAVCQSAWNVLTDRPPDEGIKDYDLAYHDALDLSYDAEDIVIRQAAALYADLGVDVEVRNQARVHLWFEERFGTPCPPHVSTEASISYFPSKASCLGIRRHRGELELCAPHGVADVLSMTVRPNSGLVSRERFEEKAASWTARWPSLTIVPWPEP